MKKVFISSILVLSFLICTSAVASADSQKVVPAKTVQIDKGSLSKKTIIAPPKAPTNWSKILDLFR